MKKKERVLSRVEAHHPLDGYEMKQEGGSDEGGGETERPRKVFSERSLLPTELAIPRGRGTAQSIRATAAN